MADVGTWIRDSLIPALASLGLLGAVGGFAGRFFYDLYRDHKRKREAVRAAELRRLEHQKQIWQLLRLNAERVSAELDGLARVLIAFGPAPDIEARQARLDDLLRDYDALRPRLGDQVLDRPKRGFSVPLSRWMRGELGDGLATALQDGPVAQFLDVQPVMNMLAQHRRGSRDFSQNLWTIYVLDGFLRRWVP